MFERIIILKSDQTHLSQLMNKCWNDGKYVDINESRNCKYFQTDLYGEVINVQEIYTRYELEHICRQLLLKYNNSYRLCVDDGSKDNYIGNIQQVPFTKNVIKSGDVKNISKLQLKVTNCLLMGETFDVVTRRCKVFNTNDILNGSLMTSIRRTVTSHKPLHQFIWKIICNRIDLDYQPVLNSCIYKRGKRISTDKIIEIFDSFEERYKRFQYCLFRGLIYNSEFDKQRCVVFNRTFNFKKFSNQHKLLLVLVKEMICAKIAMAYQHIIDACISVRPENRRLVRMLPPACVNCKLKFLIQNRYQHGPDNKHAHSANEEFCFHRGLNYIAAKEQCETFSKNNYKDNKVWLYRYLPYLQKLLRAHCYDNEMAYSSKFRICVNKLYAKNIETKNERMKRFRTRKYETMKLKQCVVRGLDYDYIKEDCVRYPHKKILVTLMDLEIVDVTLLDVSLKDVALVDVTHVGVALVDMRLLNVILVSVAIVDLKCVNVTPKMWHLWM
ncbi:hypothetical protein GJ496_008963 [Pomphorhynchus laevis]|nr:hypothetical protein GJ496_008963 [Pomphorhynchus laevis]